MISGVKTHNRIKEPETDSDMVCRPPGEYVYIGVSRTLGAVKWRIGYRLATSRVSKCPIHGSVGFLKSAAFGQHFFPYMPPSPLSRASALSHILIPNRGRKESADMKIVVVKSPPILKPFLRRLFGLGKKS